MRLTCVGQTNGQSKLRVGIKVLKNRRELNANKSSRTEYHQKLFKYLRRFVIVLLFCLFAYNSGTAATIVPNYQGPDISSPGHEPAGHEPAGQKPATEGSQARQRWVNSPPNHELALACTG